MFSPGAAGPSLLTWVHDHSILSNSLSVRNSHGVRSFPRRLRITQRLGIRSSIGRKAHAEAFRRTKKFFGQFAAQSKSIRRDRKEIRENPDAAPADAAAAISTPAVSATGVVSVAAVSDIGPYLRSNSPLAESTGLVNGGPFARLPDAVRQPLKSEHQARTAERDAMLPEADAIDDLANNRLDPWKQRLDANLAKLEADTVPYTEAVAVHRSRCMPARDQTTWNWCLQDAKVLEAWLAKLVKRGDEHNAELARFHAESKPYDARLAVLVAEVQAWIGVVEDLVKRIKRAVGETQSCTWTGKRYPPGDPNGLCIYDCTVSGITYMPVNPDLNPPCPTLRLDVPVPPAGGAGATKNRKERP